VLVVHTLLCPVGSQLTSYTLYNTRPSVIRPSSIVRGRRRRARTRDKPFDIRANIVACSGHSSSPSIAHVLVRTRNSGCTNRRRAVIFRFPRMASRQPPPYHGESIAAPCQAAQPRSATCVVEAFVAAKTAPSRTRTVQYSFGSSRRDAGARSSRTASAVQNTHHRLAVTSRNVTDGHEVRSGRTPDIAPHRHETRRFGNTPHRYRIPGSAWLSRTTATPPAIVVKPGSVLRFLADGAPSHCSGQRIVEIRRGHHADGWTGFGWGHRHRCYARSAS
jgi:hypothetical protein